MQSSLDPVQKEAGSYICTSELDQTSWLTSVLEKVQIQQIYCPETWNHVIPSYKLPQITGTFVPPVTVSRHTLIGGEHAMTLLAHLYPSQCRSGQWMRDEEC